MQVRVTDNELEFGACGCGRSPTGKCIGWHGLSESAYQTAKTQYINDLFDRDQQAEDEQALQGINK